MTEVGRQKEKKVHYDLVRRLGENTNEVNPLASVASSCVMWREGEKGGDSRGHQSVSEPRSLTDTGVEYRSENTVLKY